MPIEFLKTEDLTKDDRQGLYHLWNSEYPAGISYAALSGFDIYIQGLSQAEHVLAKDELGNVLGWYVQFVRGGANWFVLIIDHKVQHTGLGSKLLKIACKEGTTLYGWVVDDDDETKLDGTIYQSPLGFYIKNGFELMEERLELETISAVKIKWEGSK